MNSETSSQLRFDNRVVIVTGAGGGMGQEHAKLFGSLGANVIVNDLFEEHTNETVRIIKEAGGNAIAAVGSVANRKICEGIVATAIEQYGRVDVLINNAGIEIKKSFEDMTVNDLSRMLDVHVMGSWHLSQLVWPHMRKAGYGKIVMVCSNSLFGMPANSAYVTAKGALYGLMRSLSHEGKEFGIKVNCLAPVAFTQMAKIMAHESQWKQMEETAPPENTSPVCAWLAHEANDDTGEMITASGRNISWMFLAETRGIFCGTGQYTIEKVRIHYEAACDEAEYFVPKSVEDRYIIWERSQLDSSEKRSLHLFSTE